MKTFSILLVLLSLITSCSVNKHVIVQRDIDIKNSREEALGCFVEFNDGTHKTYNSLKLVRGVMKTPHLLADGTVKIEAREIKAYQNADHYAISQNVYTPKKPSYVAIETLPGFAVRIAKGNVNMYVRKFYNTQNAVDEFFVQSADGHIIEYTSSSASQPELHNNPDVQSIVRNKKYIQLNSSTGNSNVEGNSISKNK